MKVFKKEKKKKRRRKITQTLTFVVKLGGNTYAHVLKNVIVHSTYAYKDIFALSFNESNGISNLPFQRKSRNQDYHKRAKK